MTIDLIKMVKDTLGYSQKKYFYTVMHTGMDHGWNNLPTALQVFNVEKDVDTLDSLLKEAARHYHSVCSGWKAYSWPVIFTLYDEKRNKLAEASVDCSYVPAFKVLKLRDLQGEQT